MAALDRRQAVPNSQEDTTNRICLLVSFDPLSSAVPGLKVGRGNVLFLYEPICKLLHPLPVKAHCAGDV